MKLESKPPRPANDVSNDWHIGTKILVTLTVLNTVGVAWSVYSHWAGNSTTSVETPPDTKVILQSDAARARSSASDPVERAPVRSGQPAFEHASAKATPEPRAVPVESFAPSDEPAAEHPVLQALEGPDDETRLRSLQDAVYRGAAQVPVDRLHEILLTDPSDKVREFALQVLTESNSTPEEVRAVADSALADSSLAVRARAQSVIDRMNELERIRQESLSYQDGSAEQDEGAEQDESAE